MLLFPKNYSWIILSLSMETPNPAYPNYDPKNPWGFPPQRLVDCLSDLRIFLGGKLDNWKTRNTYPDQRFVVFQEMYSVALQTHAQSVLIRDHFSKTSWWQERPELDIKAEDKIVRAINMGMRDWTLFGLFELIASRWEDALRQTIQHLPSFLGEIGEMPIEYVLEPLLVSNEMYEYISLTELVMATRICLRYGGKYCPKSGEDMAVEYQKMHFHFLNKEEISLPSTFLDDWEYHTWLIREMVKMLEDIFNTDEVSRISRIPTMHLS